MKAFFKSEKPINNNLTTNTPDPKAIQIAHCTNVNPPEPVVSSTHL